VAEPVDVTLDIFGTQWFRAKEKLVFIAVPE
jgi:hypothetical protein